MMQKIQIVWGVHRKSPSHLRPPGFHSFSETTTFILLVSWMTLFLSFLKLKKKIVIEFVIILLLFYVLACGILAPWPEIKSISHALQGKVLTTGPAGKSLLDDFLCNVSFEKTFLLKNNTCTEYIFNYKLKSCSLYKKYNWDNTKVC